MCGGTHEYEAVVAGERGGLRRGGGAGVSHPRRAPVGPVPAERFDMAFGSRDAENDVDLLGRDARIRAILLFDLREGLRERQAGSGAGVSLRSVYGSHAVRDAQLRLVRDSADSARALVLVVRGNSGGIHRGGCCRGSGLPRLTSPLAN